jgi:hypothetical protein
MLEGLEEGSVAPLELSDGVMEQVEVMAKELRRISGGLLALVEGVGKLTEVVVGLRRKVSEKKEGKRRAKKRRRVRKKKRRRMTERRTEIRRWRRVR